MSFLISDGYKKNTTDLKVEERFDYWREIICDEFVKLDCENIADGDFIGELRGGVAVGNLKFSEDVKPAIGGALQEPDIEIHRGGFSYQLSNRKTGFGEPKWSGSASHAGKLRTV